MSRPTASEIAKLSTWNRAAQRRGLNLADSLKSLYPAARKPKVEVVAVYDSERSLYMAEPPKPKTKPAVRKPAKPTGSSLTLELPYPPSKNALDVRRVATTKKGKRYSARSDSPAYRAYKAEVAAEVYRQKTTKAACTLDVRIDVTLYPPDRRRRDLLNPLEALCDALTHAGVWADDSQIVRATVERGMVCEGGKCVIRIDAL